MHSIVGSNLSLLHLKKGDRVRHAAAPQWGIGELLENPIGGKAPILFVSAGEKLLILSHQLMQVEGSEAEDPSLDRLICSLAAKARVKEGKREKRATSHNQSGLSQRPSLTLPDLKKRFLSLFPASFADASYQAVERKYKIAAHELAKKLLQNMRFEEARQSGDCDAIWRDAYKILQATNLVFPNELIKFRAGVNSPAGRRQFVARLQTLLFGEAAELQYRFTSFCDFLLDIGAPKWTLATYFPFIMFPDQFMFMKPLITIAAAELCDFELNYRPQLNWLTYKSLLDFAATLKELLKDLEPRDYIDVQSFIWCTRMK